MNKALSKADRILRDCAMVNERNSGMMVKDIAERHGITPERVTQVLGRMRFAGIEVRSFPPGKRARGAT